jgi:hypothetical protein
LSTPYYSPQGSLQDSQFEARRNSSIAQYFENHPDAWDTIVAAAQRQLRGVLQLSVLQFGVRQFSILQISILQFSVRQFGVLQLSLQQFGRQQFGWMLEMAS